jgi:zinc D-Ala-D-Ala carboxypeptidase
VNRFLLIFSLGAGLLLAACSPLPAANPTPLATATFASATTTPPAAPSPSPSPRTSLSAAASPRPSPTAAPLVTLYNRYLGKDIQRQPELIKTPPVALISMQTANGYAKSYFQIFLNGKQVNGDDIRGDPTALAHLIVLYKDAFAAGFTSQAILSSYRSYDEQVYLQQTGGAESDKFLAEPGRSEHHLGTAVDLAWNAERLNFAVMNAYPQARAFYNWLKANAQRYGFIFSYPFKSNADQSKTNLLEPYVTEYKAEPWHLRYVGPDLAQQIYAALDPEGRNYLDPLSPLVPQQFLLPSPTE